LKIEDLMKIRLIRNATMRLTYGGRLFLTDPYLADKLTLPSYRGVSKNPLVDLPIPAEQVIIGAEAVIVSHRHTDHFDQAAKRILPKDTLLFCQPADRAAMEADGFTRIIPIDDFAEWQGVRITRVPGRHGSGEVLDDMGGVSGFVFQAAGEPTLYWAGDTVWYEAVAENIRRFRPDVILPHVCGAVWGPSETLIVMDAAQVVEVCRAAPESTVVAIHLEALDHGTVTRADLRAYADRAGISAERLLIPADGEELSL
jgi:L-ascorbate metabolism protein UlaG (beta-lactamase superfamily)